MNRSVAILISLILGSTLLVNYPSHAQTVSPEKRTYVSMLQLIATPEKFDGKQVVVTGFLQLGHEADLLYVHQEDQKHGILENAIEVEATEEMGKNKAKLNMKYVRLLGVFKAPDKRKSPFLGGMIANIENCDLWSDPEHPMSIKLKELVGTSPNSN